MDFLLRILAIVFRVKCYLSARARAQIVGSFSISIGAINTHGRTFLFSNGSCFKAIRGLAHGISFVRYIYLDNFSEYRISLLFQPCRLDGLFAIGIDKKSISEAQDIIMKLSCVILS